MKLYINTNADGTDSLVVSAVQNTSVEIPTLFNGDSIPLEIQFVNGQGTVDSQYNAQNLSSVKVAIGDVDDSVIVAFVDSLTFASNSNTWNGTLVLSTESMQSQLLGLESKSFHFEVQVVKNSGEDITILQKGVNVRNQLITGFTQGTTNPTYPQFSNHVLDPFGTPSTGDAIKILSDFTINSKEFKTNQIYIISGYSVQSNMIKVSVDGYDCWIGQRTLYWELLNLISDITDPAIDSDSDGVADLFDAFPNNSLSSITQNELNTYVENSLSSIVVGSIIKILIDFTKVRDDGQSNFFSANEIHLVTGKVDDWIAVSINGIKFWISTNDRGTKYEALTDPSNVNIDSDSDGVSDENDYFINDSNYTQTKAELDSYSLDPFKSPVVGDIIRIIENLTINSILLEQGTYYIIKNVNLDNVKIVFNGNNLNPNFSIRGTKWEIVNPSNQLTPDPNDNSGNEYPTGDIYDVISETFNSDYDGRLLVMDDVGTDRVTINGIEYSASNEFHSKQSGNEYNIHFRTNGNIDFEFNVFESTSGFVETIGTWDANGFNFDESYSHYFFIERRIRYYSPNQIQNGIKFAYGNLSSTPIDPIEVRITDYDSNQGFLFSSNDFSIWNGANLDNIRNPEFYLERGQRIKFINENEIDPLYLFFNNGNGYTQLKNENGNPVIVTGNNTGAGGTPYIRTIAFDDWQDHMYNYSSQSNDVEGHIRIYTL